MKASTSAKGFTMNVNKENKGGSAPVPPGLYEARISYKVDKTKDGSKDMLKIEYTLIGKDPTGKSVVGRKAFDNITYEDSMVWKWNAIYQAVTGEELPDGNFTFDELVGLVGEVINNKVVKIELETSSYEGKENNKVKKILG
jgi:hypothetical protein